jgi:hypothetical protein
MTKLTDTQLIILSAAAQRDDRGVAAIDDRSETRAAITKLLKAKLLQTVARTGELAFWETGKDGAKLSLAITPVGLRAIGDEDGDEAAKTVTRAKSAPKASSGKAAKAAPGKKKPSAKTAQSGKPAKAKSGGATSPVRAGTKLATVIGLLRRAKGASIAEIMQATGWQAHSVRGAMSGALKTKLGLNVVSEVIADVRRYRIAG